MIFIGKDLLDPKRDYVFKRIFGHVGNEDITKDLLSSIIKDKITDIELDKNPILERDLLNDKMGILDIRTTINNTTNINIEMQIADENISKSLNHSDTGFHTPTPVQPNQQTSAYYCNLVQ